MLFAKEDLKISVIEAYALYALLSAKYHAIDNVQVWYMFSHDTDLQLIIKDFLNDLDEHVTLLERELKKYSIEAPPRPKKNTVAQVNKKILTDELIGTNYLSFLQGMVEKILFSIQYCTCNDKVGDFFVRFSHHAIEQTDNIIKYLTIKGWLDILPAYRNLPDDIDEKLDCVEVFHLWTHVNYRYNNIEETMRWKEFVHDIDFKLILDRGLSLMNKQIVQLEKELQHFGIPTPKKPPKNIRPNDDKSIFEDEYIFKSLFTGIQWAGVFHANAFKNCITNDRIRAYFKKLLYEEIDMSRKLIKYGKLKGWLETPPEFIP